MNIIMLLAKRCKIHVSPKTGSSKTFDAHVISRFVKSANKDNTSKLPEKHIFSLFQHKMMKIQFLFDNLK